MDTITFFDSLAEIRTPFFMYVSTTVGAFILYALNRLQNRQPFSLFCAINIDVGRKASPRMVLIDMLVSSLLGAFVVYCMSQPQNYSQAVVGGLGMTGILSPFSKEIGEIGVPADE